MKHIRTLSLLALLWAGLAAAQTSPSPLHFNVTPSVAPQPGDCLSVLAANSSGVTATDAAHQPCGTGAGTVTQIQTGTGLTGGPISTTGTVALAPVPTNTILGNSSGIAAAATQQHTGLLTVLDVRVAGAVCDGVTNDSAAWQTTITNALALSQVSGSPLSVKIEGCMTGQSLITTSLNFTGFHTTSGPNAVGVTVDMAGSCLIGQTGGTPVIDALSSRYINWEHLCIFGSATNSPNIGIQIGRISSASADDFYFNRPIIQGTFTFAPFYNFASENLLLIQPNFANSASSSCYAIVQDGVNHWNATSAFTTQTLPMDTYASFNQNVIVDGSFIGNACIPMWVAGGADHRYIGYAETTAATGMVLYEETTPATNFYVDMHFETTGLVQTFSIQSSASTGANATPTLSNFTYIDNNVHGSTSIFAIGANVTSVTLNNARIVVDGFTNSGVTVFDTAADYSFSGAVYLPASANWNVPATFSGSLCIANACDNYKNPGASLTNTAAGNGSAVGGITGINDTAFGGGALATDTSGHDDTALGYHALNNASTAAYTTAVGSYALGSGAPTSGSITAVGYDACLVCTAVSQTMVGSTAGEYVAGGAYNTGIGWAALLGVTGSHTSGADNTAVGASALTAVQGAGHDNTAVGYNAGSNITTGASNIMIGSGVSAAAATSANEINIGGLVFYNDASLAAPTVSCGTGTNGTVDSHANSKSGTLTSGTTSVATCTLTFASAYTTWVHCRVTAQTPADLTGYSYTTSVITLTGAAVSQKYDYDCDGF